MNKNITLGIILVIILVVGLWNPTLLETLTNPQTHKPKPKPPTPTELVQAFNVELEQSLTDYKKRNGSVIGVQKFKQNIILVLEQYILQNLTPTTYLNTTNGIIANLISDSVLPYITLYNGLRSMPYKQFGRN